MVFKCTKIRSCTILKAKRWRNHITSSRYTFNNCYKFEIVTLNTISMLLRPEIIKLLAAFLPAPSHLYPFLIHSPSMLGGNTIIPSFQFILLIKVIIDDGFVEVFCAFR